MVKKIIHKISFHSRRTIPKLILLMWSFPKKLFTFLFLRLKGVDTKFNYVTLYGLPIIYKTKGSKIILTKGITLVSKSKFNLAGINHPVILATLTSEAKIELGNIGLSGATICSASLVKIGDFSGLGANSKIYDTDFHCIDPILRRNQTSIKEAMTSPVVIEEDVWIASDVTILKGVIIGKGAIIGAGSIVTKDIPPMVIAAGNPAKVIKSII